MALYDALDIAAGALIALSFLVVLIAAFLPNEKRRRLLDTLWRKFM